MKLRGDLSVHILVLVVAGATALWSLGMGVAQAADAGAGREKAKVCRTCHGIDGVARMPNAATIAGESELYLVRQLKAFRSGKREDPQMVVIAKKLSDDDIADLAAWYSSIKFTVEVPE